MFFCDCSQATGRRCQELCLAVLKHQGRRTGLQSLGFPHQDPPLESICVQVGQEEADKEAEEALEWSGMEEATRKQRTLCKEVFTAWFQERPARFYTACLGGQKQALVHARTDELLV